MEDCIFCRIAKGELPSKKVYEDETLLAFHDIHPVAPVHLLIIPKLHVASLADCTEAHQQMLGKILLLVPKLAHDAGLTNGFRTAFHTGREGGQVVFHLHAHVIGGGTSETGFGWIK